MANPDFCSASIPRPTRKLRRVNTLDPVYSDNQETELRGQSFLKIGIIAWPVGGEASTTVIRGLSRTRSQNANINGAEYLARARSASPAFFNLVNADSIVLERIAIDFQPVGAVFNHSVH